MHTLLWVLEPLTFIDHLYLDILSCIKFNLYEPECMILTSNCTPVFSIFMITTTNSFHWINLSNTSHSLPSPLYSSALLLYYSWAVYVSQSWCKPFCLCYTGLSSELEGHQYPLLPFCQIILQEAQERILWKSD